MYYLISVLTGFLTAVMITINGRLTGGYGAYTASVLIHLVGLCAITLLLTVRRQWKGVSSQVPLYYYLGGFLGVGTTLFNNLAFGVIGVTAILALGLLGQSITAIVIDQFGLFGMKKQRLNPKKLIGLGLVAAGVAVMLVMG